MTTKFESGDFTIVRFTGPAFLGADRRRFEVSRGESYFHELTIEQLKELRELLSEAIQSSGGRL